MTKLRISLARSLAIVAFLAVLLSWIIVPVGRQMEWVRLFRQIDTPIRYLRPTQPTSISPATWDCAHTWVVTAYCNI